MFEKFKPTNYKTVCMEWISNFHERHMKPAEEGLTDLQKELFEVKWTNTRDKLGADIEGNSAQSALRAHQILLGEDCKETSVLDHLDHSNLEGNKKILSEAFEGGPVGDFNKRQNDPNEMQGVENIPATRAD